MVLFWSVSSLNSHRFYTAIYQIQYVPQKKMVQITTRIFLDDLNEALQKHYHKKIALGTENESPEDVIWLQKYLSEKFKITINGQPKSLNYLSNELDNNVMVCYLNIKDIHKIVTVEVENSVLTELYSEQQNIIQFNNNGIKQNLLLTSETTKGMLK